MKLTDTQIQSLLKTMVILVDTRENQNRHITDYFDRRGIKHVDIKLDFADYSCMLPACPEIGMGDIFFNDLIAVERKASLEELSRNLSQQRERFEKEFSRANGAKVILMIESGSLQNIIEHKYNTGLNEKSFMASLFSFEHRYNLHVNFISQKYAGAFIHMQLYYWLRNYLKEADI